MNSTNRPENRWNGCESGAAILTLGAVASALLRVTRSSETMWLFGQFRPAPTALSATDRVRHLLVVAPNMRSSNTGGAVPSGCKASSPPLVDDGPAVRWPDGGPRPRSMEEDRCRSTEV